MALHHVTDLVSEHASELIHLLRALDQTAIHVDVAARHRERVDLWCVDDVEVPLELLTARGETGNRVAKDVDVAVDFRIAHDGELRVDLRRIVLPHLDFRLRGDAASGNRYGEQRAREYSFHMIDPVLAKPARRKARAIPPAISE